MNDATLDPRLTALRFWIFTRFLRGNGIAGCTVSLSGTSCKVTIPTGEVIEVPGVCAVCLDNFDLQFPPSESSVEALKQIQREKNALDQKG